MKIKYYNNKTKRICISLKNARKFFGGDAELAQHLHSKIVMLRKAKTLDDVLNMEMLRIHKLHNKGRNKYEGFLVMDVWGKKRPWRLIFRPLANNEWDFDGDPIINANEVELVEIRKVSKHYE